MTSKTNYSHRNHDNKIPVRCPRTQREHDNTFPLLLCNFMKIVILFINQLMPRATEILQISSVTLVPFHKFKLLDAKFGEQNPRYQKRWWLSGRHFFYTSTSQSINQSGIF